MSKLDITTYSKEFTEDELIEFIHDAWKLYELNKGKLEGMGIDHDTAIKISRSLNVSRFFEGKCYEILSLDPKMKHLNRDDIIELFRMVAKNIILDGKFYKFCDKLPYETKKDQ